MPEKYDITVQYKEKGQQCLLPVFIPFTPCVVHSLSHTHTEIVIKDKTAIVKDILESLTSLVWGRGKGS